MLSPMFIRAQCLDDLDGKIDDAFDTAECTHHAKLRTKYVSCGNKAAYKQLMYDLFHSWCGC